jgi:hypothetical protein
MGLGISSILDSDFSAIPILRSVPATMPCNDQKIGRIREALALVDGSYRPLAAATL